MAFVVSVAITVSDGETDYISVIRQESVIAVAPGDPDVVTERDVDLVDLARMALDRLAGESLTVADSQVGQLRNILQGMVL